MSNLFNGRKPLSSSEMLYAGYQARNKKQTLSARDNMQPSLLDRLTDEQPDKPQESPGSRLITHSELRRNVLRDLQWLFNAVNSESQLNLRPFSHIQGSTLNFGIAPLAGKRMSDIQWPDLQRKITAAILHFEPRIIPHELLVDCLSSHQSSELHNQLSIEIRGRLWCVPYPLEFLFRSEVDLENGHFELQEVG